MPGEVTNNIPYLLSEYSKANRLHLDLELEYRDKYKSLRYKQQLARYQGRMSKFDNLLRKVGRHIRLIEVKATAERRGLDYTTTVPVTVVTKYDVTMYFTNVSEQDVKMIVKRDFKDFTDVAIGEVTPGKPYLELQSQG